MAWDAVTVQVDQSTYPSHRKGLTFSIPFSSGLEVGSSFKAGESEYKALSVTNVAKRDETLLVEAKEVKNDKPKARRNAVKSGQPDLDSESDAGRSDAD